MNTSMGTRERREREKENLRRAILDAARELFVTESFDAVTMRKIAAAIEYSPTTIYLHFADKEAILDALCEEGFGLLAERIHQAASIADPIDRLRQAANCYFDFAREYRSYYTIMFEMKDNPFIKHDGDPSYDRENTMSYHSFAFLVATAKDAIDQGRIPTSVAESLQKKIAGSDAASIPQDTWICPLSPEVILAHVIWSGVHGITSLWLSGRLKMLPNEAYSRLDEAQIRLLESSTEKIFLASTVENILRGLTCETE